MPLPLLIQIEGVGEVSLSDLAGVAELERVTGLDRLTTFSVPLDSTAIDRAAYNINEQILTLHMKDETTIEYYDIPGRIHHLSRRYRLPHFVRQSSST